MKVKVAIVALVSIVFFVSCEDGYKRLQDNLGRFNTTESYLDGVYNGLGRVDENPEGLKAASKNLIEYVDGYLSYHSKDVPAGLADVTDIDNAALYYMSICKQIAIVASEYADKSATLTEVEAQESYYGKLDLLASDLEKALDRWGELQDEYAKKHDITLVDLSK